MRVAIIGSGVSGLSALWLLKQYSDHEVNIYEKNSFPGGHAHSAEFRRDGKEPCFVDTGFMSFHPRGSPNLLRFFKFLGVPLVQTDASLSVSRQGRLQLATRLGGFSLTNMFNPRAWRTAFDILRFNYYAVDLMLAEEQDQDGGNDAQTTLAQYLAREGYSRGFFDDYLLPLLAVLLLCPDDQTALELPAATVIETLAEHNMLDYTTAQEWLRVQGGAKTYIDAVTSIIAPENLHLNTEIISITSHDYGVRLVEANGTNHVYDHVIVATPANNTLTMLKRGGWASPLETTILSSINWTSLEAELHWDDKVAGASVPAELQMIGGSVETGREAITAINYDARPAPPPYNDQVEARTEQVSVTFDMNKIQGLSTTKHGPVRLTLNPAWPAQVDSQAAQRWVIEVPHQTATTASALRQLPEIQATRRISYTGSWVGAGRHEDGFAAAFALVTDAPFGAAAPFTLEPRGTAATSAGALTKASAGSIRLALAFADSLRRGIVAPLWPLLAWPVVLALAIADRVARPLGRGAGIAELRAGWSG